MNAPTARTVIAGGGDSDGQGNRPTAQRMSPNSPKCHCDTETQIARACFISKIANDDYDKRMVHAKTKVMNGRRLGFFVAVMFILAGAACMSWYGLSSEQPPSAPTTKDDIAVRSQEPAIPQQPAAADQDNSTAARATAEPDTAQSNARQPQIGIRGRPAPRLQIDRWYNLPQGKKSIDVTDYPGKVIYLYGFQSWCPGCHRYGFPALTELIEHYKDNDDVAFIAVQTTFEGFGTNTPERAKETADRYGLSIPVGHSGSPQQPSPVMRRYRTGGTPWTVIIDPEGTVQFNDFHIQSGAAVALIDRLLTGNDQ